MLGKDTYASHSKLRAVVASCVFCTGFQLARWQATQPQTTEAIGTSDLCLKALQDCTFSSLCSGEEPSSWWSSGTTEPHMLAQSFAQTTMATYGLCG